jgi:hypothetical protein
MEKQLRKTQNLMDSGKKLSPPFEECKIKSLLFSIHQKEDGKVDLETENKEFLVRSTPINVGILVPSAYDRYYCGVCGDSNRVPEFQETLGPDNKLISVNEMISAYTLA